MMLMSGAGLEPALLLPIQLEVTDFQLGFDYVSQRRALNPLQSSAFTCASTNSATLTDVKADRGR